MQADLQEEDDDEPKYQATAVAKSGNRRAAGRFCIKGTETTALEGCAGVLGIRAVVFGDMVQVIMKISRFEL